MRVWAWTIVIVYGFWFLYVLVFITQYRKVRRERIEPEEKRRHDYRDPRSMWGLLLEGVAFAIVWSFMRQQPPAFGEALAAFVLAGVSVLVGGAAVRELGHQLRIKAVVTLDHELIRTGPYAVVRHPIYTSLLGMLLATGLIVTQLWALLLAVAIYVSGTEIRVYVEENLLRKRFGPEFEEYRSKVKAYIPYVR